MVSIFSIKTLMIKTPPTSKRYYCITESQYGRTVLGQTAVVREWIGEQQITFLSQFFHCSFSKSYEFSSFRQKKSLISPSNIHITSCHESFYSGIIKTIMNVKHHNNSNPRWPNDSTDFNFDSPRFKVILLIQRVPECACTERQQTGLKRDAL